MKRLALLLALSSVACAPTQRYALRRCPTVYASLVDFTISLTAFAIGALKYNRGETGIALGYVGAGGAVALSSNIAECRR